MKLRFLATTIALCAIQFTYAQTCPTVESIKAGKLAGWKAYDSEDKQLLSQQREATFLKNAEVFALAEWQQGKNGLGTVHCYYRDRTGSDLEAYLSTDNQMPMAQNSYWYHVTGSMHCAAGMNKCKFKHQNAAPSKRFAKSGVQDSTKS